MTAFMLDMVGPAGPLMYPDQISRDITNGLTNYCILRGQIKGYNSSITTIMCQVGSYRTLDY